MAYPSSCKQSTLAVHCPIVTSRTLGGNRALRRDEDQEDKVVFRGWARMALPLQAFTVVEVRKPNVGEAKPAAVTADVQLDTKSAHFLIT